MFLLRVNRWTSIDFKVSLFVQSGCLFDRQLYGHVKTTSRGHSFLFGHFQPVLSVLEIKKDGQYYRNGGQARAYEKSGAHVAVHRQVERFRVDQRSNYWR